MNSSSKRDQTDIVAALMLLPAPPKSIRFPEWYGKSIAGVPFLLRNIINLQRGGVQRLVMYQPHMDPAAVSYISQLAADRRIRLELHWTSDPRETINLLRSETPLLILEGDGLYKKQEVAALLATRDQPKRRYNLMYPMSHQTLEMFLTDPDQADPALRLKKTLAQEARDPASLSDSRAIRFLSTADSMKIRRMEDFNRLHERFLLNCGLKNDSFMDQEVTRKVSRQMTRFFLNTALTPNHITLISLGLGLASAVCFFQGSWVWGILGALVLQISAWVDCTDGEVARLKFMESKFGSQLDLLSDNLVHWAVFFTIGWGAAQQTGFSWYVWVGGLAVLGSAAAFLVLGSNIAESKHNPKGAAKPSNASLADKMANRDFTYFLLFMALINQLNIFIIITAIGANGFAFYVLFRKLKPAESPRVKVRPSKIQG